MSALTLEPTYHLRFVDGIALPISNPGAGTLDSGHVRRLGGDTVQVDHYSDGSGVVVISFGTWLASQSGTVVALFPALANSLDTAFVGHGDTLTLHAHSGNALHVEIYVAP